MPEIYSHAPGTFCWIELGATDPEAAKAFYSTMLGWEANDIPMGPGESYTVFHIAGNNTGAAFRLNASPRWNLYVSVANPDEVASRVEALGGKVIQGPFDVSAAGRMAMLTDPAGAVINIWQARTRKGLDVVGKENTFCWAELNTPQQGIAKAFYEGLFGWEISADPHDTTGYLHIQNGQEYIGGIPPSSASGAKAPSHWLIYLQTVDCDGATAKAEKLGATIQLPPMSLPRVGRIAVLADPQGAVFALYEPQNAA